MNRQVWQGATNAFLAMTIVPAMVGPPWFAAATALAGAVCALMTVLLI